MLTGSDYTEGIDNVGGVRALEIMAEFGGCGVESLQRFRQWHDATQSRRKKGDSRPESKLRGQLADLTVPDMFPDNLVVRAYLEPDVDRSSEKFTWGVPALDLLRHYCRRKFGWREAKCDEVLLPIIKRLNTRNTQTHLDKYFKKRIELKKVAPGVTSRRMGAAIEKMKRGKEGAAAEEREPVAESRPKNGKKRTKSTASDDKEPEVKGVKTNVKRRPPRKRPVTDVVVNDPAESDEFWSGLVWNVFKNVFFFLLRF